MQVWLLAGALLALNIASAQDNGLPKVEKVPAKPKSNTSTVPQYYVLTPGSNLLDNAQLLQTLPNGNKVYALPQDRMPCVVPDMTQSNMPVIKPDVRYSIPNPAYTPANNKPIVFTQDQLKELLKKKPQ